MPTPKHVEAFEFISEGNQNEIRDFIAFGIFMRSEKEWAAQEGRALTEADYAKYHAHILNAYERERFRTAANDVLTNFAARAIDAKSKEFLKHHRKFRWNGICEAFWGAFFWSAFLIAGTIFAQRGGIDILEIYKRAAGIH